MGYSKDSILRSMRRLYKKYIHTCARKNVFWGLTVEEFHRLTTSACIYCGRPPAQQSRCYTYNGIDRIDPKKGYEWKNCAPCCYECNFIKGSRLTYREMRVVARALLRFRKRK